MEKQYDPKEILQLISETVGGNLKFGKGFMGKSTNIMMALIFLGIISIFRCPVLFIFPIFIVLIIAGGIWFYYTRKFAIDHPDLSVLDGAEWTSWKKFQMMEQKGDASPQLIDLENPKLISSPDLKQLPPVK